MQSRLAVILPGLLLGGVLAFRQIAAQRAAMLREWGWVCATDWPGMVLLNVVMGVACTWAVGRMVRWVAARRG